RSDEAAGAPARPDRRTIARRTTGERQGVRGGAPGRPSPLPRRMGAGVRGARPTHRTTRRARIRARTRYPGGVPSTTETVSPQQQDGLELPGVPTDPAAAGTITDPDHPHPGQWRLVAVQVSNWGTFHGTHDLAISSKGFFLTGGPGTGKSTLLDAISALLTPPRTLQFNAAASDAGPNRSKYRRTVASYVRGAWAMHYDQATGEFSQEVLREKTTLSVLTLRYSDGQGGTVQLSRLLLLHAGHSADSDVKSLYVIARTPLDVTDLRQFVSTQIEGKALEAAHPGTQTFRQFREYRAAFCQLLGIPDEKALGLLHKIQSAKELGDVNALLRDYM